MAGVHFRVEGQPTLIDTINSVPVPEMAPQANRASSPVWHNTVVP